MTTTAQASDHLATVPGMVSELAAQSTIPEPPMLNQWYHHRGQLLVYLQMHDVPAVGLRPHG